MSSAGVTTTMPGSSRPSGLLFNKHGVLEDNYQRDIKFAYIDENGDERSYREPAVAKFDTGCEGHNLISVDFLKEAINGNLGVFTPYSELDKDHSDGFQPGEGEHRARHSLWKSCKRRLSRLCPKLMKKDSSPILTTIFNQPITVVGVLRDTRWQGLNLDASIRGQMIRFPDKFIRNSPYNQFLVVEKLARWDVVFSRQTLNYLQNMNLSGGFVGGILAKAPKNAADRKKQQKEKKAQEKLMKAQEKQRRETAKRSISAKANTTNQPK